VKKLAQQSLFFDTVIKSSKFALKIKLKLTSGSNPIENVS